MNAKWHKRHVVPRKATLKSKATTKAMKGKIEPGEIDPRFAPVVDAFVGDRQVTYCGKGFGSTALKVNGKIFAMLSSKGS